MQSKEKYRLVHEEKKAIYLLGSSFFPSPVPEVKLARISVGFKAFL